MALTINQRIKALRGQATDLRNQQIAAIHAAVAGLAADHALLAERVRVLEEAGGTPQPPIWQDIIPGATINGRLVTPPATLEGLIASVPAGVLRLPAGRFIGTSPIPLAMTIEGAGPGETIIDCRGLYPTWGKAVLVPQVPGVLIRNLTVCNAAIAEGDGLNAAGVRDAEPGIGFGLDNVEIASCQMGILTFPSPIVMRNCWIHDNGAGDGGGGSTHEIYLGGGVAQMADTLARCGPMSTHALKSRCSQTTVIGGTYTGNGDPTGDVGGAVVDFSEGGSQRMTAANIVSIAGAGNQSLITFGTNPQGPPLADNTLTLDRVTVDTSGAWNIVSGIPTARLVILPGCTYRGGQAPEFSGWGSVTGAFAAA